jgi:Tryptophan synthase alpha chain
MNRINKVFEKDGVIMSIYFTAGFPKKNDTLSIIKELDSAGVEMIEIGLPFSDPLADGPTIQKSSTVALNNGMNTSLLFEQLKDLRKITDVPKKVLGYFIPLLQFEKRKFCKSCKKEGG